MNSRFLTGFFLTIKGISFLSLVSCFQLYGNPLETVLKGGEAMATTTIQDCTKFQIREMLEDV